RDAVQGHGVGGGVRVVVHLPVGDVDGGVARVGHLEPVGQQPEAAGARPGGDLRDHDGAGGDSRRHREREGRRGGGRGADAGGGGAPRVGSSTATVTLSVGFMEWLSIVPALRKSEEPTISKDAASVPVTLRLFVPRPSSVTEMSATRTSLEVLVESESDVTVL